MLNNQQESVICTGEYYRTAATTIGTTIYGYIQLAVVVILGRHHHLLDKR